MARVRLKFHRWDGRVVDPFMRAALADAVRCLRRSGFVRTDIPIHAVASEAVTDQCGGFGFGCMVLHEQVPIAIYVAAMPPREAGKTRAERREFVLHTLAHELAHYEQWRDGNPLQERGVNVRARTIRREVLAWPS